MTTTKTFNRGKLFRLAQAGKLLMVGSYRFDDMMGESRQQGTDKPVAVDPGNWQDRKEGIVYVRQDEFRSHGSAWLNEDGTVTLYVHSNSNYTFRIQA